MTARSCLSLNLILYLLYSNTCSTATGFSHCPSLQYLLCAFSQVLMIRVDLQPLNFSLWFVNRFLNCASPVIFQFGL